MPRDSITLLPTLIAFLIAAASTAGARAQEIPPVFDQRPYAEARKAAEAGKRWFLVKATATWCGQRAAVRAKNS